MTVTVVPPVPPVTAIVVGPTEPVTLPAQPQGDPSHIPHPPVDMLETPAVPLDPEGTPGASAYEIAVENGFVGTEAQWLASLEGADGSNGIVPVAFSFGDASPSLIHTVERACVLDEVQLVIRVPFDGVGATLSVGTASEPEAYLPTSYNAPGSAGTYSVSPDVDLAAGDEIWLHILPGAGASVGNGRVLLTLADI